MMNLRAMARSAISTIVRTWRIPKLRDIVDGVFKRTLTLLETNLDLLEQSAQDLLQRETGRCVTLSLAQMIGEQP